MRLEAPTPMLRTWDLPGSIDFYAEVIGFHCDSSSDERGWASLHRDDVKIMLAGPNRHENDAAPGFAGSVFQDEPSRCLVAIAERQDGRLLLNRGFLLRHAGICHL